ncbi:hypothetical protein [Prosthecobacter sp.]|uniref:hypothetical protein n=1 Tax=Prosthecobacter sp. TaxID=1965333 RepID=UPI003784E488
MPAAVSLIEFFSALHTSGQAGVTRDPLPADGSAQSFTLLSRAFHESCEDLPGGLRVHLEWRPESAVNALHYIYRLCQALVDRAMPEEEVHRICAALPLAPSSPDEVMSQDLTLRHLPELHAMAKSMSESDPLVSGIEAAAKIFPLSSVGIALPQPPDLTAIRRHESLWRLYIDRVIERQDASRLDDEPTRLAVADALGAHALSLAPRLAAKLALHSSPSSTPAP